MQKLLLLVAVTVTLAVMTACTMRMAPFAPHRTNTDFHRAAKANQTCLGCHEIKTINRGHDASDDCLKCHRILQGE